MKMTDNIPTSEWKYLLMEILTSEDVIYNVGISYVDFNSQTGFYLWVELEMMIGWLTYNIFM